MLAVEIHHMSSFKIMDSEDPPAFAILDDVDRYYYERSGGLVDERGYAVVYRSALDIDEPDAEVDFFAQGGSDEESEPPLFEDDGW